MEFSTSRQAMTWLHTWLGLFFGFVLMVCFFYGTLSVFDREIDRWAIPETRFQPQPMPSFDKMLLPIFEKLEPDEQEYATSMPGMHDPEAGSMTPRLDLPAVEYWAYTTHRDPVLLMGAGYEVPHPKNPDGHNHIHGMTTIDPRSGATMSNDYLKIGSAWFYPLHYSLNINWQYLGFFIVGLAGLMMLVALITGVIIHRKIFREFFTFRPWKRTQRSALDLHNMTGVIGFPFHLFFAFTGLLIFIPWYYMPVTNTMLNPLHQHHEAIEAAKTGLPHKPAGVKANFASVDAMVEKAKLRWAERGMAGEVGYVFINHVGDANGYVSVFRAGSDRVALVGEGVHFQSSTGEILYEDPPRNWVDGLSEFLMGLHLQHFEHWFLRWLYVMGGLTGCVCIATGFIFFVEKRKYKHAKINSQGSRVVDALAVTAVTGMVIAAVSILLANRLLPADMVSKGDWEKNIFWLAWLASLLHALWRSAPVARAEFNPSWHEQCWIIAVLCVAAVIANWVTTDDHLFKTIFTHTYWPVAGVDLSLLATTLISLLVSKKLFSIYKQKTKPDMSREVAHAQ